MLDLHVGRFGDARIAALIGDDGLVALAAEQWDYPNATGAVYRAKLAKYDATADWCLVDAGTFEAILPGKSPTAPTFPVQIKRGARDGKRAEVTTDIILPGRYMMAAPAIGDVKTSSRLRNGKVQRDRANRLGLTSGWILRRAFASADDADIVAEAGRLSAKAERLKIGVDPGPSVPSPPIWSRIALDDGEPARIFADRSVAKQIQADLADYGIDVPVAGQPVDLAELLIPLLEAEVDLPRGGRLTIEPTRALTAIDVDAGGSTHEAANQAAIKAIARHLRLRNIGGIVVIDLVSQRSDWRPVVDSFRRLLADDPARTSIVGGVSPLGLLQMTRERRGQSLADAVGTSIQGHG